LNYKYFIAKRYLFSKKDSKFVSFITFISILGVALGVATLIITVSILNGFEKEVKDKVAGLVSHIQIKSFLPEGLSDYKYAIEKIKLEIPEVESISPIVQKEAVIRDKETVEGIILKGIVPETDLSTARNRVVAGDFNLQPIDSSFSRLLVGDKLAKKLDLKVGDKVIVYETGLRDYDDIIIYTDLETAQDLFDFNGNVTGIEMTVKDIDKVEDTVLEIKKRIGYPYYPRSLFKLYKGLFTWVELHKEPTPIILGLIIIVATFNIIGTLLMLVLEKTQSVGVLKSLGSSRSDILKIFLFDGLIIGVLGIIFGNIIGIGISLAELKYKFFKLPEQYYMKNVPILLEPEYIILISCITIVLVFLATIIPAYLASRFEPVKSMRFM
jgi:lipoprotein-releasing system permease protein